MPGLRAKIQTKAKISISFDSTQLHTTSEMLYRFIAKVSLFSISEIISFISL